MIKDLPRKLVAESLGTAMLLVSVVGSGIMADSLSGGNDGLALLGNAMATGAMLYVIITTLGPISGAHFNPAVTVYMAIRDQIEPLAALAYVPVQIIGGILGVWLANFMFDLAVFQYATTERASPGTWAAEIAATFGLLFVIVGGIRFRREAVPMLVALYITGAYFFTASTSFANPAVTIARMFSDTFAGIQPPDATMFILMQVFGVGIALVTLPWLFREGR